MENLLTTVTKADLAAAVTDERGVKYSPDGLRLLKAPSYELSGNYAIKPGTKIICNGAFRGCTVTGITIPDSVSSIGAGAFMRCSSLSSIIIPDSVTAIGGYAFRMCRSLKNVNIHYGVKYIGCGAFEMCVSLTNIIIPDGVTSIDMRSFAECRSLTSISIPDSVTSIEGWAFLGCQSLTSISIPDGVTSIGDRAFECCTSLNSIEIPDSVTCISDRAFSMCNMPSITIPVSVKEMRGNPFNDWNGELINKSPYFTYEDGVLFSKNKDKIIAFRRLDETSYIIPDSVVYIGDSVF